MKTRWTYREQKVRMPAVPGSDEAGGDHCAARAPGDAGEVVLDVHAGLDVRHELNHHDRGHRVEKLGQGKLLRNYENDKYILFG